ncbi:MAG: hypothetical protein ACXABG_09435 [Promethearchaeota archaeon]|jgi:hypothetical protein
MDITQIDFFITQLGYYLNAILIPLATALVGRKLLKDKKATGTFNPIRAIIFGIFLSFSALGIIEFFLAITPFELTLLNEWFGGGIESFDLYGFLIGIMVTLGMTMIFYANRWESLYYSAIFFFGGMLILFLLTGFDAWLETYIMIAGAIGVVFLYFTGFRVKDNGALGLAIFFTIAFGTILIEDHWVTQISILVYSVFIFIFSVGWFKPFKQREVVA